MLAQSNKDLFELLKSLDVIGESQLQRAFDDSLDEKKNVSLGEILLDRDLISDDNLGKIIADLKGIRYVNFDNTPVDFKVFNIIPQRMAKKFQAVVFKKDKDSIHIAMHDPENIQLINSIVKKTKLKPEVYYATNRIINDALGKYTKDFSTSFNLLMDEYLHAKESGGSAASEAPIIKAVDMFLSYSYQQKASDVHVEPEDEYTMLRFRVDGVLKDAVRVPKTLHTQIVTRIKVLAGLRTDEHQTAQDGKLKFKTDDEEVDIRVSVVPVTTGEKVVMRLLSERSRRLSLTDLGFSKTDLTKVKKAYAKPYGMILSTGPTGSGKTTTLYSLVKLLNKPDINIMTIEDPVEYDMDRINQIQVNNKANLTFSEGLKSIVRQDPDVILVGEIRDEETAGIAVNSAMTGHLVLSTLHTNDAPTSIPRLIDMEVEPFLVSSSVNVIIAQRLLRKICEHCIISKQIDVEDILKKKTSDKRGEDNFDSISADLIEKHFPGEKTIRVYEGKGCKNCHDTGYVGRVGIFEVLEVSDEIRELIVAREDSVKIKEMAISQGMTTMFDDGLEKVKRGITSLEEIMRVTKE
jgi:type IV pilus assembly protein PilB